MERLKLDAYRQKGDALADYIVVKMVEEQGVEILRSLFAKLSDFSVHDFKDLHPKFHDFYNENAHFPVNFSKKEVIRATGIYMKHQQTIGLVLGCYSLPYCYLGEDGARVLMLTERIGKDTYTRLKETGNFLRRSMNFDYWDNEKIFSIIFKVRFLHAFVRYFTLKSPTWKTEWGVPINQEDMAGTNLAFSFIVLRGLRKLGYSLDEQSERAYLTTWKYIGHLLGVEEALLATSIADAARLDKEIATRQFRESATGIALTASLMECYNKMTGSCLASEFFQAQSRFLLDEKYADMLKIPKTRFPISLLNAFNQTTSFLSNLYA